MTQAQYRSLVLPPLRRLADHQLRDHRPRRYRPSFLYLVLDQLRWRGVRLAGRRGPWSVGVRWLGRGGRGGLRAIPLVQRDSAVLMTDTWEQARGLAGLLNWCSVPSPC